MKLPFKDTFNVELPADPNTDNTRRQVVDSCFSFVTPKIPSHPKLLHVSEEMLETIGLDKNDRDSQDFLEVFSGKQVIPKTRPYAMCYGGHQFGHWAGQLGDGRAINLGEMLHNNKRWALQLKGAGKTPYSRTADGLAVLRSSIREHLCSEAMYHLGVPTTRSLSLCLTGDEVLRDILYDGHPEYEKGAVVCRVAPSFIRFGNFEIFTARQDKKSLRTLLSYTLKHFYPHIARNTKDGVIAFFDEVAQRTFDMVLHWQRVGFVHGVMNTDNMSILGLTIDYGPYGWLEGYDPTWTPNTTDAQHKRYRYGHQPNIALWNLLQLANALYPLVNNAKPFETVLQQRQKAFKGAYIAMMRKKLGLLSIQKTDASLIKELERVLQLTETDMTLFFRLLSTIDKDTGPQHADVLHSLKEAFYFPNKIKGAFETDWHQWITNYINRLRLEHASKEARLNMMQQTNPKYVLRNYMAQMAIDRANKRDYSLIDELYQLLKVPYAEQPENKKWFAKRPEWARHKVGCSMLSCSS